MSQLERMALSADFLPGESVVVLYFSDQKPLEGPVALLDWRLDGQLTRMLLDEKIQGCAGEFLFFNINFLHSTPLFNIMGLCLRLAFMGELT